MEHRRLVKDAYTSVDSYPGFPFVSAFSRRAEQCNNSARPKPVTDHKPKSSLTRWSRDICPRSGLPRHLDLVIQQPPPAAQACGQIGPLAAVGRLMVRTQFDRTGLALAEG